MEPPSLDTLVSQLKSGEAAHYQHEILTTLWLTSPPNAAATAIFSVLRSSPLEAVVQTVIPLLANLAHRNEKWGRIVERSIMKRGRCPKQWRAPLRELLARLDKQQTLLESSALTEPLFKPSNEMSLRKATARTAGRRSQRIRLDRDRSAMLGIPQFLLNELANVQRPRFGEIQLDLCNSQHLYIGGLATIACLLRDREWIPTLVNVDSLTERYLTKIGFFNYLERRTNTIQLEDAQSSIAIQSIVANTAAEVVAPGIVDIVDAKGYIGESDKRALYIAVGETVENVLRHAGSPTTACVGAQFYPQKKKLSIVIADTGIGIKNSFKTGRNKEAAERITSDESALDESMRPLVTSKPLSRMSANEPGHAGYGLFVVSELAVRNGGSFVLTSGTSTISRYRKRYKRQRTVYSHSPWKGTIVQLLLDLENLLPISEVYRALPPPYGYEEDEFFS